MTLDYMKSRVAKSYGMFGIVPPVVAGGVLLRTVNKGFKNLDKNIYSKKRRK